MLCSTYITYIVTNKNKCYLVDIYFVKNIDDYA